MSYDAIETSEQGRRPVELYTFFREFQAYRYTSADRDIKIGGATYFARSISRGEIQVGEEVGRNSLSVRCQRDLEVADLYRTVPPSIPVTFMLQQYHEGDSEIAVIWTGRVVQVEWSGAQAEIRLESVYTTLRRVGLRRMFQKQCPHVLYGQSCRVNREAFRLDAQADAISGSTISVAPAAVRPDGYYSGGMVEYVIEGGLNERRFIYEHAGASLTLNAAPLGLELGATLKIYPGCDHTISTCKDKFANQVNYGGMPYFATKNPFGGQPIF